MFLFVQVMLFVESIDGVCPSYSFFGRVVDVLAGLSSKIVIPVSFRYPGRVVVALARF